MRIAHSPTHSEFESEFEQALRRGLGRAVLWLSSGAVAPARDLILHACIHDLSYDLQTENNRALYMFDIIQATGEPDFYARAIEHALSEVRDAENEAEDKRSVGQMFDLLGLLAKDGDLTARHFLYSFFEDHATESDVSRAEVLVDVDGLDGYLFVIHQWLRQPRQEDDHWYEAFLLESVEKRFGPEEVQSFLEKAALDEPAVGVYVSEVRQKRTVWKARQTLRPARPQPEYAELRRLIFDPGKRIGPMVWARWGEQLADADAERLAQDLLLETDPERLERGLFLFGRRPFPLDHSPLLSLAESPEQRVASAARAALAQIEHPSIRTLALALIETSSRPWELVALLSRNFQEGDEAVIERVLNKPWDADELHWLGLKLRNVFENNLTPTATAALTLFYEQGYCTICRYGAVKLLADLAPLPPDLVKECRYDAYVGTREVGIDQ